MLTAPKLPSAGHLQLSLQQTLASPLPLEQLRDLALAAFLSRRLRSPLQYALTDLLPLQLLSRYLYALLVAL